MSLPEISDNGSCTYEPSGGIYSTPGVGPAPIPSAIDCVTHGDPAYVAALAAGLPPPQPTPAAPLVSAATPPTNFSYTVLNPPSDPKFNIYLTWTDPSSSVQGVEIYRADLPFLIYSRGPPSDPTTTAGWFLVEDIIDSSGVIIIKKNPIVTDLLWDTTYVYYIRTSFFNIQSLKTPFSEWVKLELNEVNLTLERANDRCPITPLQTLQNKLSPNQHQVPKVIRYSRIAKGGGRGVICETWRPQGWNSGEFPRTLYPITNQTDIEIQKEIEENKGNPKCGPLYCKDLPAVDISPYSGNLLFGSAIQIVENTKKHDTVNTPFSTGEEVNRCGDNDTRKTGSKLKIN